MKKAMAAVAAIGWLVPASAAQAASDSSSSGIPGTGAIIQANAWECNAFWDKCSFTTSAKALKGGSAYRVSKIVNAATVSAHGLSVSISTSPSGTIVSNSVRRITWTNTNTWISDINGIADPSWNTVWMSTCSDASAFTAGVKGFASACVGN